jgi:2-hydroxychromene-2-carboxylate isomerase
MTGPIDFYFDFISPYGYLGATQIESMARHHGRDVRWRPFLLGVTVMQVMGLKPLMQTPLKSDYVRLDKQRMASLLDVPLAAPEMSAASSVAAARAFYWVHDRDPVQAVALARRLLQRLWVDGRSISSADDVVDEAASLGIDAATLRAALADPAVKDRLRQEVDACIARGVFGSPFFIVDEQPIWGVDRLWMLEHWLEHGHWRPAASG